MDNDTQLVDAFYKDFYAHRAKNPPWIDPHTFPKKIVMPSVPHAGTTNIQAVSIVHSTVPIAPPAASPAAPRQAATARSDEMIGRWEKITSWPPK